MSGKPVCIYCCILGWKLSLHSWISHCKEISGYFLATAAVIISCMPSSVVDIHASMDTVVFCGAPNIVVEQRKTTRSMKINDLETFFIKVSLLFLNSLTVKPHYFQRICLFYTSFPRIIYDNVRNKKTGLIIAWQGTGVINTISGSYLIVYFSKNFHNPAGKLKNIIFFSDHR